MAYRPDTAAVLEVVEKETLAEIEKKAAELECRRKARDARYLLAFIVCMLLFAAGLVTWSEQTWHMPAVVTWSYRIAFAGSVAFFFGELSSLGVVTYKSMLYADALVLKRRLQSVGGDDPVVAAAEASQG